MSNNLLSWQQVHERLSMMLHNVQEKEVITVRFPRGNFTDILRIMGNFTVLDLDARYCVEIVCSEDVVIVEFSFDGDDDGIVKC